MMVRQYTRTSKKGKIHSVRAHARKQPMRTIKQTKFERIHPITPTDKAQKELTSSDMEIMVQIFLEDPKTTDDVIMSLMENFEYSSDEARDFVLNRWLPLRNWIKPIGIFEEHEEFEAGVEAGKLISKGYNVYDATSQEYFITLVASKLLFPKIPEVPER